MAFKIICLSLPECQSEEDLAKKHFSEIGVRDVTFFHGLHGETSGLSTENKYNTGNLEVGFRMGYKETERWFSHYCAWSACNLLWDDYFLILETDSVFCVDWHSRLVQALQDAPRDFDVLHLSASCTEGKPKIHISGEVYEVKYPEGTSAILYAKKSISTLLETQRRMYSPIDLALAAHSFIKMKVYTVLPAIVSQRDTVLTP
jgi:GR25 family glycosyltransferase involved in LPS biosynthesis